MTSSIASLKNDVSPAEWEARVNLAAAYRLTALFGWDDLVFTHISARVPGPEHHFLINPYGMMFDEITASSLVKIDLDGRKVSESPYDVNPAGFTIHSAIHAAREDAFCVMHTHSPYASAFGVLYEAIPMVLSDSALCLGGRVPVAPYCRSGTAEFAEEVVKALGMGSAVIWGNHGAMVVGTNLALTFSTAHALEDSAKVYAIAKQMGTPVLLPADEVAALRAFWLEHYGQKPLGEAAG